MPGSTSSGGHGPHTPQRLLPPSTDQVLRERQRLPHLRPYFATDRSYLPEIRRQPAETEPLVERRYQQYQERYGQPMSDKHVWLSERLKEVQAMRRQVEALEAQSGDASGQALRVPGVLDGGCPDRRGI